MTRVTRLCGNSSYPANPHRPAPCGNAVQNPPARCPGDPGLFGCKRKVSVLVHYFIKPTCSRMVPACRTSPARRHLLLLASGAPRFPEKIAAFWSDTQGPLRLRGGGGEWTHARPGWSLWSENHRIFPCPIARAELANLMLVVSACGLQICRPSHAGKPGRFHRRLRPLMKIAAANRNSQDAGAGHRGHERSK